MSKMHTILSNLGTCWTRNFPEVYDIMISNIKPTPIHDVITRRLNDKAKRTGWVAADGLAALVKDAR